MPPPNRRRRISRILCVITLVMGSVFITTADQTASSPGPSTLEVWLAVAAMLSAIGAVITMITGVVLTKGRWKIDRGTIDKMDAEREATRRKEDDERHRRRMADDERRADGLREEMASLTERNAEQFEVILDLRDEIAELRQFFVGIHKTWDNEAVTEVNRLGGNLRPPPDLPPHRKKRRSSGGGGSSGNAHP